MSTVDERIAESGILELYEKWYGPNMTPDPAINYRELIINKFNQITSVGFTIDEFQKAMVILCLIRFVIYSIRYNPITSFKICAIGAFSCFLWILTLNDLVRYYYDFFGYCRYLTRMKEEEYDYRRFAWIYAEAKFARVNWQEWTGERSIYHFEWTRPLFNLVPERFHHISEPIYEYVKTDLFKVFKKFYKSQIRRQALFLFYIFVVRVGKKYCPYHVRWHTAFLVLHGILVGPVYSSCHRARSFMIRTLIPQGRWEDVINVRYYLGGIAFVHISFVCYAALHAVFSQYFYIPFIVQNVELHVGDRPKDSIYSGGYTSWQDAFTFYDLDFKESMRLWWGFLGRGTRKQREQRKKKKRRRGKGKDKDKE